MAEVRAEFVYALRLVDDKWYIGRTTKPKKRILQHAQANGSAWTKQYRPIELDKVWPSTSRLDEDNYTLQYMKKYGFDNVRGGTYTTMVLSPSDIGKIRKQLQHAADVCFKCQQPGHFAAECGQTATVATKTPQLAKKQKVGKHTAPVKPIEPVVAVVKPPPPSAEVVNKLLTTVPFDLKAAHATALQLYKCGGDTNVDRAFQLWQKIWHCTSYRGIYNGAFPRLLTRQSVQSWESEAKKPDGNVDALFELALCFHSGIGRPCSAPMMIELYTRAADAGHTGAMINLAGLYRLGISSVAKDTSKAMQLYRRAADLGNAGAACNLAYQYDYDSIDLDLRADDTNNLRADAATDAVYAQQQLLKAANLGHHGAMRCAFDGEDLKKAVYWTALSTRTAYTPSMRACKWLEKTLTKEEMVVLGLVDRVKKTLDAFNALLPIEGRNEEDYDDMKHHDPTQSTYYKTWDCQRGEYKRYRLGGLRDITVITDGAEEQKIVEPILKHLVDAVFLTRESERRKVEWNYNEGDFWFSTHAGGDCNCGSGLSKDRNSIVFDDNDNIVQVDGKPFSVYLDHDPSSCRFDAADAQQASDDED